MIGRLSLIPGGLSTGNAADQTNSTLGSALRSSEFRFDRCATEAILARLRGSSRFSSMRFEGGVSSPELIAKLLALPCAQALEQFEVRRWRWSEYEVFERLRGTFALRIGVETYRAPRAAVRWPTPYLGLSFEGRGTGLSAIDLSAFSECRDLSLWFGAAQTLGALRLPDSAEYAFLATTEEGPCARADLSQLALPERLEVLELSRLQLNFSDARFDNVRELRLARSETRWPSLSLAFPNLKKLELDLDELPLGLEHAVARLESLEKLVLRGSAIEETFIEDLHERFSDRVFIHATRQLGDSLHIACFADGRWSRSPLIQ